jgi:hypothetical protein
MQLGKFSASSIVSGRRVWAVSGSRKDRMPAEILSDPNITNGNARPKSPFITVFCNHINVILFQFSPSLI